MGLNCMKLNGENFGQSEAFFGTFVFRQFGRFEISWNWEAWTQMDFHWIFKLVNNGVAVGLQNDASIKKRSH